MMCPINNLQEALLPHLPRSCREESCAVSINQTKELGRLVWPVETLVQQMPSLAVVQGQIWVQGGFGQVGHGQEVRG